MKKIYSTMVMLAMMVAALSFTACGGDDDDNNNNLSRTPYETILIDGAKFYIWRSVASTERKHVSLYVGAVKNPSSMKMTQIEIDLPKTFAELRVGDTFANDIKIYGFYDNYSSYNIDIWKKEEYIYKYKGGNIVIIHYLIEGEMIVRFNNLQIEHSENGTTHTYSGTLNVRPRLLDANNNPLPFDYGD